MALAVACVEGLQLFHCHVHPGLCRGFVAAVNLRGVPKTKADRKRAKVAGLLVDMLSDVIREARRG